MSISNADISTQWEPGDAVVVTMESDGDGTDGDGTDGTDGTDSDATDGSDSDGTDGVVADSDATDG